MVLRGRVREAANPEQTWKRGAAAASPSARCGRGRLTRVRAAANGRATARPLFSSRSGAVEERVRRAPRQRRRSHRRTAGVRARPEPLRLGERRAAAEGEAGCGLLLATPEPRLREPPPRKARPRGGDDPPPRPRPPASAGVGSATPGGTAAFLRGHLGRGLACSRGAGGGGRRPGREAS